MVTAQEIEDRREQLRLVAAYFRAHPHQDVTQDTLEQIGGGRACRNRVAECVRWLKMPIETINIYYQGSDGRKHRGLSEYRGAAFAFKHFMQMDQPKPTRRLLIFRRTPIQVEAQAINVLRLSDRRTGVK